MSKKISSSTAATAKDAFEAAALGRPLHALFAFRIPTTRTHHKRSAKGLARDLEGKANILEEYLNHPAGVLKQLEDDEDYERWTKGERRQIKRILRHADVVAGRIAFRDIWPSSSDQQVKAAEELKWRTDNNDRVNNFKFENGSSGEKPITIAKIYDGYTYIVFQVEKRDIEPRGKWPAVAGGAAAAPAAEAEEADESEESEADADADTDDAPTPAAAAPSLESRVAALEAENIAFRAQLEALRAEMAYIKHKKFT